MSDAGRPDLLARAAELVAIPSVSHEEAAIADWIEARLSAVDGLVVERVDDNVVARTELGRDHRLAVAGHLDTVPANGNQEAVIDGDRLFGLGAADMKGGLAVMVELASALDRPAVDVTFVFYACEEVESRHSGLLRLARERPDLLAADVAVLAEPTGARVEAGCQGSLRLAVTLGGTRAHTARAWTGANAIHRLAPLLTLVAGYRGRRPILDGCEFHEALQAVKVESGVANNVVPDRARIVLNHRFAPDRDATAATEHVAALLAPALDRSFGDRIDVEEAALPAPPALDHQLLAALVDSSGVAPRAKLGWTDVSFFAARGVPAANFGPGDPELAHCAGEWVSRAELEMVHDALARVIREAPPITSGAGR